MNKILIILLLLQIQFSLGQISTEIIPISETYSSNGEFKLKSISYDDDFPTLRGESIVSYTQEYESPGIRKTFYKINRAFDLYDNHPYFAAISNDGRKVAYFKNQTYFKGEEHKNITYYVDGQLTKAYDTEEFIACNKDIEECNLFYSNKYEILDYKNSNATIKFYKPNTTEKDKFLNKNFIFNKNDTIYIIDGRKMVTLFDLNNNKIIKNNVDFESLYDDFKHIEVRRSKIAYYRNSYNYINQFENSTNGEKLSKTIEKLSGYKYISLGDSTYHRYKNFRIELTGYLNDNGKFEIEKFECDSIFNKEKIKDYIISTKFKADFIPREVDKQYFKYFFGAYRNFDIKIAKEDTQKENEKRKQTFLRRLQLDSINGIYIPKNLFECMTELDKTLSFKSKKELKEAKSNRGFNSHMGGLGMWLRNNWGINGGSRIRKYFNDRNIGNRSFGNDDVSGVIISQYRKWLNGNKKAWREWEKQNPLK